MLLAIHIIEMMVIIIKLFIILKELNQVVLLYKMFNLRISYIQTKLNEKIRPLQCTRIF